MNFFRIATVCLLAALPVNAQEVADGGQEEMLHKLEKLVLYSPRKYAEKVVAQFIKDGGRRVDYTTPQGRQCAWLIGPEKAAVTEKLWIMCGGNGTLALELAPLARSLPMPGDAFLLVEYPGYGECQGEPSPAAIRENLKSGVLAAAGLLKIDPAALPSKTCVFGHSLGCAAALLAVEEFHLRSAVLCSPFTSTLEMARAEFTLPEGFKLQHPYDNRTGLAELVRNSGRAWIFHGEADEVIPVAMSKTLAVEFKSAVTLRTVAGGRHNDIFRLAARELVQAMEAARK